MKKIVASVGLVAVGASSLQAASAAFLSDPAKPWSVSATLRGFYDDNINSIDDDVPLPSGSKRQSWGYEISPAFNFNWAPTDQTTLTLGYVFSYKYFENKPAFNSDHDDKSHTFNVGLDHTFNPRLSLNVSDSFVVGQEPDVLRAGNSFATFQRVSGDNVRNYGRIGVTAQITPLFGLEAGYSNGYYNYDDTDGTAFAPSIGGLLNRLEHNITLDTRWHILPETTGVIGYQFRQFDYTEDEDIGIQGNGEVIKSDDRNLRSHAIYAGADHNFRPDLTGSLRAGARFTDYYNDDNIDNDTSPYVQASMRWRYVPDSYFEVGYSYDLTATDVVGAGNNDFVVDAEAHVVYATLRHRIMPKLYGTLTGQFQNSSFNGGAFDDDSENFFLFGGNLEYQFNRHFSAHAGYNFDRLDSDIPLRSFSRNRAYFGVTASY
jgi:hypothetical protein